MYIPTQFRETDIPTIHAAIRAAGLATLVTTGPDGILATPLPLLLDPDPAPHGTLLGHVARANPQWQRSGARRAGAGDVFRAGRLRHALLWYATKRDRAEKSCRPGTTLPSTPMARSSSSTMPTACWRFVTRLTERHEGPRAQRWAVDDAPADFIRSQLKGIVGLRLPIACAARRQMEAEPEPQRGRSRGRGRGLSRRRQFNPLPIWSPVRTEPGSAAPTGRRARTRRARPPSPAARAAARRRGWPGSIAAARRRPRRESAFPTAENRA